jgi:hypothetical protein
MIDSRTSGALGGAASGAATGFTVAGPWGAAVGAVAGGIMGALGGGGEDEAQRLADKQAYLIGQARDEQRRRDNRQLDQEVGAIKQDVYSANIQFSGSSEAYTQEYGSEFRRQMAWEDMKAEMESRMVKEQGQIAADSISMAGIGSMVQGIGSAANAGAFGSYTKAGGYSAPWSG